MSDSDNNSLNQTPNDVENTTLDTNNMNGIDINESLVPTTEPTINNTDDLQPDTNTHTIFSDTESNAVQNTITFDDNTLQYTNDNNNDDSGSDDDVGDNNDIDDVVDDIIEADDNTAIVPIDSDDNNNDNNNNDNNNNDNTNNPVVDVSETLPLFASEANKQLNAAINAKRIKLNKYIQNNTDLTDRIAVIQQHIKNIQNEEKYTQSLLSSKLTDIQSEKHLTQLSTRTLESYQHEIKYLQQQCTELKQNIQVIDNNIYATSEQIQQCKTTIQNKEGELVQWNLIEKQKLSDIEQIQLFTSEDMHTLKQLQSKCESLNLTLTEKKQYLHELELKTKLLQIELNQCATAYQQSHTDKTQLIEQYNRTVQQLQSIELQIGSLQQQCNEKQLRISNIKNKIQEQHRVLNTVLQQQKQIQFSIGQNEANLHDVKTKYSTQQQQNRLLQSDIQFIRYTQRQFKQQLKSIKQNVTSLQSQCTAEQQRCDTLLQEKRDKQHELEQEQYNVTHKKSTKNNHTELLEQSQSKLKQSNKQYDTVKQQLITVQQQLFNAKHQEQLVINEIQSIEAQLKSFTAQKNALQNQISKQTEILYNITYTLNQQKQKLQTATSEVSYEAKIKLEQKCKLLEQQCEQEQHTHTLLQQNYKKLQNSYTLYKKQLSEIEAKNVELQDIMCEINLICNSTVIQHNKLIQQKNSLLLLHNNLKLSLTKQKDNLYSTKQQCIQSESDKLQLNQQYKQRLIDINTYLDIQKNQLKLSTENKSELLIELQQRKHKIQKLKLKYETLAIKLAQKFDTVLYDTTGHILNEEKNQAYYIIQVAQQREQLTQQGDALQQQIDAAGKELGALHNTAALIGERNQQYKQNQAFIDSNCVEYQQKQQLEQTLRTTLDVLYKNKAYQRDIQAQYNDQCDNIQYTEQQVQQYRVTIEQLEHNVQNLNKSITDQQQSVQRATTQYNQRMQRLKQAVTPDLYSTVQQYKTVQERKSRYKLIVNMLRDYIESKPELLQYQFNHTELLDIIRPLTSSTTQSNYSRPTTSRSIHSSASSTPTLPPINDKSRPSSNRSNASIASLKMAVNTLRIG